MVVATDLRDPTRDVVVESKDKVACGACGRRLRRPRCCGKRSFCTASVDAEGVARVFHSTGRVHRPARARRERRGCRERDRARCDVVAGRVLMSSPFAYQPQTTKGRNGNDKQERTKEGTREEGRKEEGRRTEQTITSPTKDFSLQVAGAANRSRTMPTSGSSRHHLRIRTWVTASNHRRITAPHTRTFSHGAALAGIPLEALPPNIVIVVATQENVARPLPGEGTHDVAGVRLWWKRTGVEHWIGVVPSQAVETEGGGTCRRQWTR